MRPPPPRSTRTVTLFPCTTLFRSPFPATREGSFEFSAMAIHQRGRALGLQPFDGLRNDFGMRQDIVMNNGFNLSAIHIAGRSEEHTSELQSLMRISYAVFCLKKKKSTPKHMPTSG